MKFKKTKETEVYCTDCKFWIKDTIKQCPVKNITIHHRDNYVDLGFCEPNNIHTTPFKGCRITLMKNGYITKEIYKKI